VLIGWSTNTMFAAWSQPYSLSRSSRSSVILNGPFSVRPDARVRARGSEAGSAQAGRGRLP